MAVADLSPSTVTAWRDLCVRAVERNPFFRPELVLPAADLLHGRDCHLVTVSHGGRLLACLLVRGPSRWRPTPRPMARPWRPQSCFLGPPLVDRDPSLCTGALRRL